MSITAKIPCTVSAVIDHGRRVYTLELHPDKLIPRFLPGQFLHLALDDYDPAGFWPDSRVFSIASSPLERKQLRITYSVVGRFTTRMENELSMGSRVWVKLPYGDFIIGGHRDAVLFAGGTGITAFTAFLESLTNDHHRRVTLLYGARNWELLTYHELIGQVSQRCPSFRVYYFCEEPGRIEAPMTVHALGRLSVQEAWPLITDPMHADHFLSGPPAMLKSIMTELADRDMPSERVHIDAW